MNHPGIGNQYWAQALPSMLCLSLAGSTWAQAADLNWLQGNWCQKAGNHAIEEVWLSDVGGNLIGMSRTVVNGKVALFEFMRIETSEGVTRFTAHPGGGTGTTFIASRASRDELVVENPEHDFPQKIVYRRDGQALVATISGPGDDGQEHSINFNYQTCKR